MKRQFALLTLQDGTAPSTSPQLEKLQEICKEHGVNENPKIMPAGTIVLVAGSAGPAHLESTCRELLSAGFDVQVVVDALANHDQLSEVLLHLNELWVRATRVAAVSGLLTAEHLVVTCYPAAYATSSIAVIMRGKTKRERRWIKRCAKIYAKPEAKRTLWDRLMLALFDKSKVLWIIRKANPFKGCKSMPGGFHTVGLETLEQCCAREAQEEVSLKIEPSWLTLVDVRSEPWRDPREHVIDHGYAWYVPRDMEATVKAAAVVDPDQDAQSLNWDSVAKLLAEDLAFDHKTFLRRAVGLD